nr:hypothetical protein [Tanacetum cinerariifolium]
MDLSWTVLPEFADDTVTDYSRPSPAIESTPDDAQNKNPSVTETEASPSTISPKPFIKNFPTVNRKFPTVNKKFLTGNTKFPTADQGNKGKAGNSRNHIDDKGYWDSGCSRHMTGNISYLFDYEPFDGGYVSFGQGGCKITGKGTIKTGKLELKMCTLLKILSYWDSGCSRHMTGNISYLFDYEPFDGGYVSFGQGGCKITGKGTIKTECIVLVRDFKLIDDTNVLLKTPRQHNMYSIDLNNIVPHKDLTCLVAKESADECMLCYRRLENFGKFEAKGDEGYFIWYSMPNKAFRVFNKRTKRVEEKLHVEFLENKAIKKGAGPNWLFDIDSLTNSMNYVPVVVADTNSTNFLGTKDAENQEVKKDVSSLRYIALPNWIHE